MKSSNSTLKDKPSFAFISLWTYQQVRRREESRSAFNILTGKPTEKRYLRMLGRKLEVNIRMDLKEIGFNTRNYVDSVKDKYYCRALMNAALSLRVSYHELV